MGKNNTKIEKNPSLKRKHIQKYWQLYVLMVVPVIYFIIFKYVPLIGNVLAFRRYRPGKGIFGTEWVGLRYFKMFMKDPAFWNAFKNTIVLSITNIVITFPLPIIFAILLNEFKPKKTKKVVQTVSYMPRFISTVVVIAIMSEILSPSSGILNRIIVNFGGKPIYFMNEPKYFRMLYVLSNAWQFTGWTAIIYLASITSINDDLYEAAEIDGASKFKQIFYVTIPSILPTIMVMLILEVGRLLSLGFEKVLLMYTPTNSGVSDIIDTLVYRVGLTNQNYSYATAIGLFSGIIGLILVSSSNALSRKLTGDGIY